MKSRFGGITEDGEAAERKYYVITALGKRMLDEQYESTEQYLQTYP